MQLKISNDASVLLKQKLNYIPEEINRVCDFAVKYFACNKFREIKSNEIDLLLKTFISESESVYSIPVAHLSSIKIAVILAIVFVGEIDKTNSKEFLNLIPTVTAASVNRIILRLLDSGTLQRFISNAKIYIRMEDPLFVLYIGQSGMLLAIPERR